jgi:SAM-dependent methyltransferase
MAEPVDEREYLCVDEFLRTLVDARALRTAFELRLIDHLLATPETTLAELTRAFSGDARGVAFLIQLLAANAVVDQAQGRIALSPAFRRALRYRDLMETKLEYGTFVQSDLTELFTTAIGSPTAFFQQSKTFQLFCYDRAQGEGPEDYELTKRWMRITTCLTRYEAHVAMRHHDYGRYERILDIGGNSGEFVLQICSKHPAIRATVFDLPMVCRIGREHVRRAPAGERITFVEGDALSDPIPGGQDLVSFKSMLHDWPDTDARQFMTRARDALRPGGTMLVFERGPVEANDRSWALIPFLLFFRSFRPPEFYTAQMATLGLQDVQVQRIDLESPFFLVTGRT